MKSSNLHLQYARALYKVAEKQQVSGDILKELKALTILYQHKKTKKLMDDLNGMERTPKEKILQQTFEGKIQPLLLNLLKILAVRRRIQLLPRVNEAYRHIFHEEKGIHDFIVHTARQWNHEEEHAFTQKLEEKMKGVLPNSKVDLLDSRTALRSVREAKIMIQFEHHPELIGGLQIYEKGYLTDYSLQNYLHELQRHLQS